VRDFSAFELAARLAKAGNSENLGTVTQLARRDFEERETFTFRAQVPCIEYMSLLIESALLLRTNRNGRLYVGFGRMSSMEPVADRFLRIADVSERVSICGVPDWEPPRHPRIRLIRILPDSSLAKEWFVIADSSTLGIVLAAKDEERFETAVSEERWFSAVKSSDPSIVSVVSREAEDRMDEFNLRSGRSSVSV
jgi:DICT domain-containing protein